MSGAVELEAELRAGLDSPDGLWWKVGDRLLRVDPPELVRYLLDTIAALRADNERLGRERDEARARIEELDDAGRQIANMLGGVGDQLEAAEAERDTLLAQVEKMRGVLTEIAESDDIDNALDPERNKRLARAALTKEPS